MEEASSAFDLKFGLRGIGWCVDDLLQLLDQFVEDEDVHDTKHDQEGC